MTLEEEFIKNICSCCKTICNKTLVFKECKEFKNIMCLNYIKDETKIKGYVKSLEKTSQNEKILMRLSGCDW